MGAASSLSGWRRRVHLWIDHGAGDDAIAAWIHGGLVLLISANVVAISLVGEYIAKIFEEVKSRPHFIRRAFVRDGEVRTAVEATHLSKIQQP